jgi:hypothetical protein
MAEENKIIIDADVKPLKKQLREATQELQVARQKYGEFSNEAVNAAQKVALIRDEIDAANEASQLFDPGKRFQALTTAASTAAGGIAAVQGAMALFGGESQEVEKALLKVQSAMALSQGLSQLKDIGKVGEQLKISFKGLTAGANGFKKALISTGIGALVVAVGLLVTYWEDILGLVNGVSSDQKKLNEDSEENLKVQQEKLDAIDGQSNQLKLQGKSEEDILKMKIAQTDEAIKAAEINLQNAENTKKAQVEASQRNKAILQGFIGFLSLPITLLLKAVDTLTYGLKQTGVIDEASNFYEQYSGGLAELIFDPKAVAESGDATIKEAQGQLDRLKEKQAGFILSQQDSQKAAGEKARAEREKQNQKELEAQAILDEAKNKMLSEQKQQELAIEKAYADKQKKLDEAGIKDDGSLEAARSKELQAVRDKFQKEEADKEADFQKQLNEIRTQNRLAGIKDENEKARQQILLEYQKQRDEVLNNEKLTSEQKTALQLELAQAEKQALDALQFTIDEANAIKELEQLDAEMKKAESDFEMQRSLLDQKDALLKEYYEKNLISDAEYTEGIKENSDARKELDKAEYDFKISQAQAASAVLGQLSELAGKRTAAGKALGIAEALINTSVGVTQALKQESVLPSPFDVIAKVANVATILASGFKAVKAITAVQVPGGGGGGGGAAAPNISVSAPAVASAVPTLGSSPVTALGAAMQQQPPVRAYVVESEVTGSQKRVADIERRAGF